MVRGGRRRGREFFSEEGGREVFLIGKCGDKIVELMK